MMKSVTILQLTSQDGKTIFANNIDNLNDKVSPSMFKDGTMLKLTKIKFQLDNNNNVTFR